MPALPSPGPAALATLLLALATPRSASACATCSCGDPTLTTMGTEKPFAGRLRLAAELTVRSDEVGDPRTTGVQLHEQRLDLALSYAPHEVLVLALTLPLVRDRWTYASGARETALGPGDVELRGRWIFLRDRDFSPRHLLSLHGGLRLPTAMAPEGPAARGGDAQPGSGALVPLVGLAYGQFRWPWTLYGSATLGLPAPGRDGLQEGRSLLATVAVQHQPLARWALRLALDARHSRPSEMHGAALPDSGGTIVFLSPQLIATATEDLLLAAGARWPVLDDLHGAHDEGPQLVFSATRDF